MSRFKAVLFDYDDTLVDTYGARLKAAEKAAEGILDPSLDMDKIMKQWAGRPQQDIWMDLTDNDDEKSKKLMDRYADWYWNVTTNQVQPFPGTREILDVIKAKGIALAIVTSKIKSMQGKNGPYGVVTEMERMGLDSVFDVVVGWPDVKESKPAPAPLFFALDQLGVSPQDALMVGDSHIDVKAAKNAGVTSAAATWGTLNQDLLTEAEPDYLLSTPSDLNSLI